jgi:lipopolysaccharide cholinephosphotransferase
MYQMEPEKLRFLQLKELEILLEVNRICKKYNLTYYLIGGTALGAVRHKGFIPWDDDIDLGLPREDYNKLLNLCKTELGEKFFLQTNKTDKNYMYQFGKIRLNNTAFVQEELKNFKIHHGIFIDIFPIDGIPNNAQLRKTQKTFYNLFNFIRDCKVQPRTQNPLKSKIRSIISRTFPWSLVHSVIDWVTSWVSCKQTKLMANILGRAGYDKEAMPVEFFGDPEYLDFEGHLLPVPKEWDKYLTRLYGNYMELPPINKRVNHNPYLVNFEKQYNG